MAYQVKRSAKVEEELELISADGKTTELIKVQLNASAVAEKVSKHYAELLSIQAKLTGKNNQEDKMQLFEEMGNTVVVLFRTIFGEEDTERIIQFYENDYIDMCSTIMPFIKDVVIPKVRSEAQKSKRTKMQSYSRSKSFIRRH